jgi:hypothetical protein
MHPLAPANMRSWQLASPPLGIEMEIQLVQIVFYQVFWLVPILRIYHLIHLLSELKEVL